MGSSSIRKSQGPGERNAVAMLMHSPSALSFDSLSDDTALASSTPYEWAATFTRRFLKSPDFVLSIAKPEKCTSGSLVVRILLYQFITAPVRSVEKASSIVCPTA